MLRGELRHRGAWRPGSGAGGKFRSPDGVFDPGTVRGRRGDCLLFSRGTVAGGPGGQRQLLHSQQPGRVQSALCGHCFRQCAPVPHGPGEEPVSLRQSGQRELGRGGGTVLCSWFRGHTGGKWQPVLHSVYGPVLQSGQCAQCGCVSNGNS